MNELIAFPLLGALIVFFVLTPGLTLLSTGLLALQRQRTDALRDFGASSTWLLLVLPVLGPVLWLGAAAFGQFLFSRAIPCLREHDLVGFCLEPAVFATLITGIVLLVLVRHRRRAEHPVHPVGEGHPCVARLDAVCGRDPLLRAARSRIVLVSDAADVLHTCGWLRPRIELRVDLAERLDDEALRGALLHELEHARMRDPLRFLIARVCLALNPVAALLRADHERWRLAREVECDARAVEDGAAPLALAEALVAAARPCRAERRSSLAAAHLCHTTLEQLELRVALLMHPAPRRRHRLPRPATVAAALALCALVVAALAAGHAPLDLLHLWTESSVDHLVQAP